MEKIRYELSNFYFERNENCYDINFDLEFNKRRDSICLQLKNTYSETEWKKEILSAVRELLYEEEKGNSATSCLINHCEKNCGYYFLDLEIFNIITKNVFYILPEFKNMQLCRNIMKAFQ